MHRRAFLSGLGFALSDSLVSRAAVKLSIFLTIDDGPSQTMEDILKGLGSENKATFFIVGRQLENPDRYKFARNAVEQGHAVGNHSYNHPFFSKLSLDRAKNEIMKTQALIERIYKEVGNDDPRFFRFPFGDKGINRGDGSKKHERDIAAFLAQEGFKDYLWDVDSGDWRYYAQGKSVPQILRDIGKAKESDVVLAHDLPITPKYTIPYVVRNYNTKALKR